MDFNEFAESIKAKHPQYKEVDNLKLAKAMVEKYPQYKEKVTFETEKPKEEYIPKPIEYDINNPEELAMGLSQQRGIPYQEAMELVAQNPNVSKAMYRGEEAPIMAGVADVATLPFRGVAGLSALAGGENPMARMAQTKAESTKGFWNGVGEFGENMMLDPFTYAGGGIANLARKGIAKVLPKLGAIGTGALEGLTAGSAEFGLEQERRRETGEELQGVGDYAMQAGLGGAIGGGAGKLKQMSQAKKEIAEAPSVLKQSEDVALDIDPIKNEAKMLQEVQANTGFNKNQAKSVPMYAREMFSTIDDEGKQQLNKYISQGRLAVSDPSRVTPFDEVGKMFDKGEKALNTARKDAGQRMGEIEAQYLEGGEISTAPIKEKWNKLLAQYGSMSKDVAEDGTVTFKNAPNKTKVGKNLRAEFEEADEIISELDEVVTGERLRSLESALADITPSYASTRSGKMNSKADAGINSIISDMRDLTGKQIKEKGGDEALDAYNLAKADYGKYWQAQDFLQRRLGLKIKDEAGEEIATRGGSMVKAMTNSTQDRNSKSMARLIQSLTGDDIGKHATMAKFAMQTAEDTRAGFNRVPNMTRSGIWDAVGGWVGDKTLKRGQTAQTFEGMTELVKKAQPQRTASFLDLVGNNPITKYGAKGLQNFGQPALRSGVRSWGSDEQQGLQGLGN
jgi:hypothetical protein